MNIIQGLRRYNLKSMERRGINLAPRCSLYALSPLSERGARGEGRANVRGKLQLDNDSGSAPELLVMEVFTSSSLPVPYPFLRRLVLFLPRRKLKT